MCSTLQTCSIYTLFTKYKVMFVLRMDSPLVWNEHNKKSFPFPSKLSCFCKWVDTWQAFCNLEMPLRNRGLWCLFASVGSEAPVRVCVCVRVNVCFFFLYACPVERCNLAIVCYLNILTTRLVTPRWEFPSPLWYPLTSSCGAVRGQQRHTYAQTLTLILTHLRVCTPTIMNKPTFTPCYADTMQPWVYTAEP